MQQPKQSGFKGSTISSYNNFIINEFKKNSITNYVIFDITKLQYYVEEKKDFTKGLISYLFKVQDKLDKVTNNHTLKSCVYQIIAELSILVYPNLGLVIH